MFRCRSLLAAFVAPAALIATLAASLPAQAQQFQRSFPQTALRGELTIIQPPELLLNGAPARLAPGARIKGGNNLLVMSGAIIGQTLPVHYTIDTYGLVKDVWLLREDELARKPWPRTAEEAARWIFDPVAQTWAKP